MNTAYVVLKDLDSCTYVEHVYLDLKRAEAIVISKTAGLDKETSGHIGYRIEIAPLDTVKFCTAFCCDPKAVDLNEIYPEDQASSESVENYEDGFVE